MFDVLIILFLLVITSLYTIKLIVVVIEEDVVYCAVRTDSLNVSQVHVRFARVKMLVMFVC